MSTPSSPPHTPNKILSAALASLAILCTLGAVAVIVVIASSGESLGTLASSLIVVAFFAGVAWFVMRRNLFHRP